jgi:hypothetical protein
VSRDDPRWVHSTGQPYDDFDAGHTAFTRRFDECDRERHEAGVLRPSVARARKVAKLVRRLFRGALPSPDSRLP